MADTKRLSAFCRTIIAAALSFGGCGDDVSVSRDAGDAGQAMHGKMDAAASYEPPVFVPPEPDAGGVVMLSQTGLYADMAKKVLAPDLIAFEPQYALWSDGAEKHRWLRLPPGERIDTRDQDHWRFPIGTMAFKEFSLGGKRLETRLVMRTGPGAHDYFMGAFAWNEDESDARLMLDGARDVRGTEHDVPASDKCPTCHNGDTGRVLGYSAVQQPDAPHALLSDPPALRFSVPGDEISARALGYLHANCGHCHNENGTSWPDTDMDLRLRVADSTPEETAAYRSTVGKALQYFDDPAAPAQRITRGHPEESGLYYRMSMRGPKTQMPPIATEQVDEAGLATIRVWIESL